MAHFAQLNENSVVTQVIVVNNSVLIEPEPVVIDGVMYTNGESEARGVEFCKGLYGADTNWVQTSYNGSFRGKYAAIGDTYDAVNNVFSSPDVAPSVDTPVVQPAVEVQQTTATQITTTDLPAITSAEIPALTSEQITGL